MAFKGFPTKEALDLARCHTSKARLTHEEVAEDVHDQMIHIDDWAAAQYQLQELDPKAEDGDTLDRLSHIDGVADEYRALKRR